METLVLIDGNSLLNRAFYALPLLTNQNGEYSNAVYGFTKMLLNIIEKVKPQKIMVAFDYGKKNFRHDIYKDYKGTRKATPSELVCQFPIMKKVLQSMNITLIEKQGIEADDIIGTVAKNSQNYHIIIYSGDRDLLQLVDDNTELWLTKKGTSEIDEITNLNIKEKYGVTPKQIIELKALMGDSSDNIPGVAGIGEKTALNLLNTYTNIDGVYANIENIKGALKEKLNSGKEMAYLSRTLATINTNAEIEFEFETFNYDFPFNLDTYNLFKEYDFRSLLNKPDYFVHEVETSLEKNIPCEIIKIESREKLKEVLKFAYETKQMAFNLIGEIEFAFSPNFLYQISTEITFFDELGAEEVEEELSILLEDKNISKIVFDLKENQRHTKCKIQGETFDLALAKYVLYEKYFDKVHANEYFAEKQELTQKMKLIGVEKIYTDIEKPLVEVLIEMENNGFKIDKNELYNLSENYNREREQLVNQIYVIAGQKFNLNSPKQLGEILFINLGISDRYNKKHSTSVDVLEKLALEHPIIPLILRYRKVQKIVSTYIDVYKDLLEKNGEIIHTIFNQTLTNTGRLSSSEPNLQNIPVKSEDGKNLRKIFVSRFENGKLISADYSQIELRLVANLSEDTNLLKAYQSGEDIHKWTASQIFNIPLEDVTSSERNNAKAVNFGIIYGISDFGLATNLNITRNEAKVYIDKYYERFPQIKTYMQTNVNNAKKDGYVKTYFGRIRRIPELNSNNYNERMFGERVAMNMPLQGTASDIMKLALIKVYREFKKQNMQSLLILTIHDEIIVDAVSEEIEKVKEILKNQMENIINFKIPLKIELNSGKTWFDCK